MIYYKTEEEIELMRNSSQLVSKTLAEIAKHIQEGIPTLDLDTLAETFIRDHGAEPGFKGYHGFPYSLCISVNDAVVHGFPSRQPLQAGDIVSVDCGVKWNGYYGDSAYTFAVGDIRPEHQQLLQITKESLYKGIEQAVAGKQIGDISAAVQQHTEKLHGYGVVRKLVGHGLGRNLHESPEVPNYGKSGKGLRLKKGLVIAIEPMINLGTADVYQDKDGWTIRTKDGKVSAHFEHSIAINNGNADILSRFDIIENSIKSNKNLFFI